MSAISAGRTTITLETIDRTNSKFSASFVLEVKANYISGFSLGQSEYNIEIGETIYPELILSPPDAGIKSIMFSFNSSQTGVASTNNANRSITGKKEGSGVLSVSVTFDDKTTHTAQATINVLPMQITSFSFTADNTVLVVDGRASECYTRVRYEITPSNASYTALSFSVSDESVVDLKDTNGTNASGYRMVYAVGPGQCTITMTVYLSDGSVISESIYLTVIEKS